MAEGGSDGGEGESGAGATAGTGGDTIVITGGSGEGDAARDVTAAGRLFTAATPQSSLLAVCGSSVSGRASFGVKCDVPYGLLLNLLSFDLLYNSILLFPLICESVHVYAVGHICSPGKGGSLGSGGQCDPSQAVGRRQAARPGITRLSDR